MAYGQNYVPQPQGIDSHWRTGIEVYFYLLYTPSERHRLQSDIDYLWTHNWKPVKVIHQCTSAIHLLPNMSDETFVHQLYCLLQWEGMTREQLMG